MKSTTPSAVGARSLIACILILASWTIIGCDDDSDDVIVPAPVATLPPLPTRAPGAPPRPIPGLPSIRTRTPTSTAAVTPTATATVAMSTLELTFSNACVALESRIRLFDQTAGLVYPENGDEFVIGSAPELISIDCRTGNQICYGGRVTNPPPTPGPLLILGVGPENDQQCLDCCLPCSSEPVPAISLCPPSLPGGASGEAVAFAVPG